MNRSQKIQIIRHSMGLSIENLSRRLGFSSTLITRLETGKSEVSDEMLGRYCKEFNIDTSWAFDENSGDNIVFLDNNKYDALISDRVLQLRQEFNMNQKTFAHYVGVPQSAISKLETGKSVPGLHTLTKIAEACHVGIDWLQLGDENKKEYPIDDKILSYLWNHKNIREMIYQYMNEDEGKE